MKQEIIGWQWHQLDHIQIICTLLQTDNHAMTPSVISDRPDALSDAQPTMSNDYDTLNVFTSCNDLCEIWHKRMNLKFYLNWCKALAMHGKKSTPE